MPVLQIFLARTRSLKRYGFGKQQVTIRPAARWNLLLAERPAGQAIRALTWLGPDQASAARRPAPAAQSVPEPGAANGWRKSLRSRLATRSMA
jgi:hypothetical protein